MRTIEIRNSLRNKPRVKCGENAKTLIIASIGTSDKADSLDSEIEKAQTASQVGANVVTDHSFYGDIPNYHRRLVNELDILISTVGCYEFAATHQKRFWKNIDHMLPIKILEEQVLRGVDIITVHSSLKKEHLLMINDTDRLIPTTSKGGGIISNYMQVTKRENPYYEYFDEILEMFKKFNVTLSLGTTFRPATICDGFDKLLFSELKTMGGLVERAISKGVNVMVEGIGHATIGSIPTHVFLAKKYCHNVPYRTLPMATDAALGFDHISGAISGAVAVANGADAITCMSRAEHIGLPNLEDLKEAIIATKIAAHCGELMKLKDFTKDLQISKTRWKNGCKGDWESSIYPEGAKAALITHNRLDDQLIQCGMCGDFCGISAGIAATQKSKIKRNEKDSNKE